MDATFFPNIGCARYFLPKHRLGTLLSSQTSVVHATFFPNIGCARYFLPKHRLCTLLSFQTSVVHATSFPNIGCARYFLPKHRLRTLLSFHTTVAHAFFPQTGWTSEVPLRNANRQATFTCTHYEVKIINTFTYCMYISHMFYYQGKKLSLEKVNTQFMILTAVSGKKGLCITIHSTEQYKMWRDKVQTKARRICPRFQSITTLSFLNVL